MPAQVGFPVFHRPLFHEFVKSLEKFRLAHDDVAQVADSGGFQVGGERDIGVILGDIGDRIFIVVGDGVAQLHARAADFGKLGLEVHHCGGARLGIGGGLVQQGEHGRDMLHIGFSLLSEAFVQIIVAVWQTQPALAEVERVNAAVFGIR